jgi:hypothetical protein
LANSDSDPEKLIRHLRNHEIGLEEQRRQLDVLGKLNSMGLEREGSDPELEASIESMEIAYRMQSQAMDAFDVRKESAATQARYGSGDFAV